MSTQFYDLNGELRMDGLLVGGYTPPTTNAAYGGNDVAVTNAGGGRLTWDTLFNGTALLDRSVPDQPAIITAGVYAVSVIVAGTSLTVGGYFAANLELDWNGADQLVTGSSPLAIGGDTFLTLGLTFAIPAGGVIVVGVTNRDGVSTRNFHLSTGYLQRLA